MKKIIISTLIISTLIGCNTRPSAEKELKTETVEFKAQAPQQQAMLAVNAAVADSSAGTAAAAAMPVGSPPMGDHLWVE